jgi:hyperosmotically inducible protein
MRLAFVRPLFLAVALGLSTAACAVMEGEQTAGSYVDDATISTQVRAKIVQDSSVSLTDVNVETYRGEVQLTGFVKSASEKARAAELARTVKGVRAVKNDITIRS